MNRVKIMERITVNQVDVSNCGISLRRDLSTLSL